MALPFCFKAFKALRVTHLDSPSDDLRKHPTSCGLWTCGLTDHFLFLILKLPAIPLGQDRQVGASREGNSFLIVPLPGLPWSITVQGLPVGGDPAYPGLVGLTGTYRPTQTEAGSYH